MKEEILINYINKLTKGDIKTYITKECIEANEKEIDLIYDIIKNHYDEILNNDFITFISKYEKDFNRELYLQIIEKFNKYKSLLK
jgi:hypothetical protein